MGMLDDVLDRALPGGGVGKPLILALLALLASGTLFRGGEESATPAPRTPSPTPPPPRPRADEGGGLLDGLGGLLDRFRQAGQAKEADSWVKTGPNEPVSPGQVGDALGPNIVKSLAERTGLSEDDVRKLLSQLLPGVVDKMTPGGRMPTLAELGFGR